MTKSRRTMKLDFGWVRCLEHLSDLCINVVPSLHKIEEEDRPGRCFVRNV